MEILSQIAGDFMEVRAKGRLDGYWADHLSKALDEILRQGHHHVRLDLSEVSYISSMGIRVLVDFYKRLHAIHGVLAVSEPSPAVRKVLDMVGLTGMLMSSVPPATAPGRDAGAVRELDRKNAMLRIFDLGSGSGAMRCRVIGDAGLLEGCRFGEDDCCSVVFPESRFAVGLGALGHSFEECRTRFGEFLSVAGAAAYQPTDGSNVADYLLTQGTFAPELQVLYGLVSEGEFALLSRFEAKPDARAVGLGDLAETALEIAGADYAWLVLVAESAGLVGATLRRPPVKDTPGAPFTHPEIRDWLSFTTERAHSRAISVVSGLAARSAEGDFSGLLRPVSPAARAAGHFHAAAFSYRPLPRGLIDLSQTVRSLFEHETLLGVLHLIGDDRESVGVAESEFVRGACWIGPVVVDAAKESA